MGGKLKLIRNQVGSGRGTVTRHKAIRTFREDMVNGYHAENHDSARTLLYYWFLIENKAAKIMMRDLVAGYQAEKQQSSREHSL